MTDDLRLQYMAERARDRTSGAAALAADVLELLTYVADLRKSPPSNSETAELDARIVRAVELWYEDGAGLDTSGIIVAFKAKREALAPPSLEERIRALIQQWEHSDATYDELTLSILEAVKAHES